MGPLHGYKILNLANSFSGALSTMIMSDLGAEVIEFEAPNAPNFMGGPKVNGHTVASASLCRGKKSVFLDLYDSAQKELFLRMVEDADAVISDRLVKELDELGVGYDTLKERNPKIVLTLVTPFGQTGPLSGRAADETTLQAMSGIMSMVGDFGGEPIRVGTEMAGSAAAYYTFIGTMTALYQAANTGEGAVVDIAELDAMFSLGEAPVIRYDMAGMIPVLIGNRHVSAVPLGDQTCKDGKQLVINVSTDEQFAKFAAAMDAPHLIEGDLRYTAERIAQRTLAEALIAEAFLKFDRDEVVKRFEEYNIPYGIINDAEGISNSEQAEARKLIATITCDDGTKLRAVASPIKMSGLEEKTEYTISDIGCDTFEVAEKYISEEEAKNIYSSILSGGNM